MRSRVPALAGAVLLAAIALSARLASAVDAREAEKAFKARCGNCHSARKLRAALVKPGQADAAVHLEAFLPTHYAPDARERKLIIDYLTRTPAAR